MASQTTGYITSVKINDGAIQNIGSSAYGVCTIAAGTAAKTVEMTGFKLVNGATIHVRFTNSNTVANPTLNVNSTGAKKIFRYGTTTPSTSAASSWNAGAVISFTYDSSLDSSNGAWIMNDWVNNNDNTDRSGIAYCSTAAGTAAKVGTMPNFSLATNQVIILKLDTTSTVASATLNVNGTGAKTIRIGGAATTTSNFVAGYWWAQYDGTYWNLTRIYFTDTNDKVNQSSTTTSNWRKIVLGHQNDASAGTAVTAQTDVVYVNPDFEYQPSTGIVRIKSSNADIIKLYRSTASSGAFISYFNNNQTTNYWRAGMNGSGNMVFAYNGTEKITMNSSGNVAATTFNNYTLAAACAKGVDTSIAAGSTSTNLPTSAAVENRLLFRKGTGNDSIVSKIIDTSSTQNTASAQFGLSIGGNTNNVYGQYSTIINGVSNNVGSSSQTNANYSVILSSQSSSLEGNNNAIINSYYSTINGYASQSSSSCDYNTIIGSNSANMQYAKNSAILSSNGSNIYSGGTSAYKDNCALISTNNSSIGVSGSNSSDTCIQSAGIIFGNNNKIYYGDYSGIVAGSSNTIGSISSIQSSYYYDGNIISGGYNNTITGQTEQSEIAASNGATIGNSSNSSANLFLGGTNSITVNRGYQSALLGANGATISSQFSNSAIAGANGITINSDTTQCFIGGASSITISGSSSFYCSAICGSSGTSIGATAQSAIIADVGGHFGETSTCAYSALIGSSSSTMNGTANSSVLSSSSSEIGGGQSNSVFACYNSEIGGGQNNIILGSGSSTITTGAYNTIISGYSSTIGSGSHNIIIGELDIIPSKCVDTTVIGKGMTADTSNNVYYSNPIEVGTRGQANSITIPFSEILDVGTVGSEIVIDLPAGYIYQLSPGDYTYPGAIGYYSSRYGYTSDSKCGNWTTSPVLTFDFYYAAPGTLKHEAYNSYNLEIYDHNYCSTNSISNDTSHSCNMFGGTSFKIKVKTAAVSSGSNPNNYILVYGLLRGNRFPYTPM